MVLRRSPSTSERTLFNQLSVFAGSFDLPTRSGLRSEPDLVVERATDVVDVLVALVDKSMVQVINGRRYQLLETLREYGRGSSTMSGGSKR